MNKKTIKESLKKEYDSIAPRLNSRVTDTPIITATTSVAPPKKSFVSTHRALFSAAACVLIVVAVLCATLLPPKGDEGKTPAPYTPNAVYIAVDVNPSVQLVADSNGCVTSVIPVNRDAEILIADQAVRDSIKGKSATEAVNMLMSLSVQLGYVDADGTQNAVKVEVFAAEQAATDKLTEDIRTGMEGYAASHGWYVVPVVLQMDSSRAVDFLRKASVSIDAEADTDGILAALTSIKSYSQTQVAALETQVATGNDFAIELAYKKEIINQYLSVLADRQIDIEALNDAYELLSADETLPMDVFLIMMLSGSSYRNDARVLSFERMLNNYNDKYDTDISSSIQLGAQRLLLQTIDVDATRLTVEAIACTLESLNTALTAMATVFSEGTLAETLTKLLDEVPESTAEFDVAMGRLYEERRSEFIDKAAPAYNATRQPTDKATYDSYIESQTEGYEGLLDYWNSLHAEK